MHNRPGWSGTAAWRDTQGKGGFADSLRTLNHLQVIGSFLDYHGGVALPVWGRLHGIESNLYEFLASIVDDCALSVSILVFASYHDDAANWMSEHHSGGRG